MGRSLEDLKSEIIRTLEKPLLRPELTAAACGRVSEKILSGELRLPEGISVPDSGLRQAAAMFSEDRLMERVNRELGDWQYGRTVFPLGVLFHVGAGNMAGLGAYSVIEGLLTGNINLLKPASEDFLISRFLLRQLVNEEPKLSPYVHVFHIPSDQQEKLRRLAGLADAAVVWGGNDAVRAVRNFLPPDRKLIEWGHKVSFAYISMDGASRTMDLFRLARHLAETEGRYCNSCQLLFLDSENMDDLLAFKKQFGTILESVWGCGSLRETAGRTLRAYSNQLSGAVGHRDAASLFPVRLLPRKEMVQVLRGMAGALQTACLICNDAERDELSYLLIRSGVTRVCGAGELSGIEGIGGVHDGEYALRRYCKIVEGDMVP